MNADPSHLWPGYRTRSATFENPTAAAGRGGTAAGGRKGAAFRVVAPGERVVLAELEGPGTVTHLWLTFDSISLNASPATRRAQLLEVFYDDLGDPSVSVPAPDFFGVVHGLAAPYASALTAVNEGRGYTSRIPLPFGHGIRIDWQNASGEAVVLYYQVDVLLGPVDPASGFLHASFRRENPTISGQDFVVAAGLRGPGRFLGWVGGVRVFDPARWWGEGEVKFYLDGDGLLPSICGTGTEDYLDSAWGLGTFHAPQTGAPLVLAADGESDDAHRLVGFYRWHLSDPVVFERALRVTIQQIGSARFGPGETEAYAAFRAEAQPAGHGWIQIRLAEGPDAFGLYERSDDWCATSFVYCAEPQPVPPVDVSRARADLPPSRLGLHPVRRG